MINLQSLFQFFLIRFITLKKYPCYMQHTSTMFVLMLCQNIQSRGNTQKWIIMNKIFISTYIYKILHDKYLIKKFTHTNASRMNPDALINKDSDTALFITIVCSTWFWSGCIAIDDCAVPYTAAGSKEIYIRMMPV